MVVVTGCWGPGASLNTLAPGFLKPIQDALALVPQTTGVGRPLLRPTGWDLFPQALFPLATESLTVVLGFV